MNGSKKYASKDDRWLAYMLATANHVNARRIINGTDKANQIADYGKQYYAAISYTK